MNKFVYKIEHDNIDLLNDLQIKEYLPIQENLSNNKLIINKLELNDLKLFFETGYLQVVNIEYNKLYLKLSKQHIEIFNFLDNKCSELYVAILSLRYVI